MTQPIVPFWFAAIVLVSSAMVSGALLYNDPSFVLAPTVRFVLFIINLGLSTLLMALNIKKPSN
ncbi:MAG TPA: hypothetical protein VFK94_06475 [Patescibacteria group bacterium]|nr:hypothetical protein [Patescibacteria group bacterium]